MSPAPPSPEPLLPRVASGDAGAIEACLDRYGALVWSLARKHLFEPADAEDGVQEAFVALWKNAGRFDPAIASETTFVAMIARRRLLDLVRRRARTSAERSGGADALDAVADADRGVAVDDAVLSPVEVREEAARARAALAGLRPEQREVLELALGEGLSQSEIARRLATPLGTVKSHARRGLKQLRALLAQGGPLPPHPTPLEARR